MVNEGLDWRVPEPPKIPRWALAALAASEENSYIAVNLHVSYDRVLRVGPPGPALFYYLNGPGV